MTSLPTPTKWDARFVYPLPFRIFANSSSRYLGPVPHDAAYYGKALLGGALACGLTHAGITPVDVAKCNMQVRQLVSSMNTA